MSTFTPCKGKTACHDDGEKCLICDRSFTEIEQTRNLIDALAEFVIAQGYDNVEEFAAYVAGKVVKKVKHRREQEYHLMFKYIGLRVISRHRRSILYFSRRE